ncbi:MAG: transposase [Chloroflexi bacterium]|nr:transposase [Chloroflexota bacterium]
MGVRIASLIAYLRTTMRIPIRKIQEYLHTMHQLHVSAGEIVELLHRIVQALTLTREADLIKEQVSSSGVAHVDETGWREGGQNGYVWCFCTPQGERVYRYDKGRWGEIPRGVLGPGFKGVLCTDFYGGYNFYGGEHQRCWVHLLRDSHGLREKHPTNEKVVKWAEAVGKLYE